MASTAATLRETITARFRASKVLRGFIPVGDLDFVRTRGDFVDSFMVHVEQRVGSVNACVGCSAWCGSTGLDAYVRAAGISHDRSSYWNDTSVAFPRHLTDNLARNPGGLPMFAPWVLSESGRLPITETVPSRRFATPEELSGGLIGELERSLGWFEGLVTQTQFYERLRQRIVGQGGYSDDLALYALAAHWIGNPEHVATAIVNYEKLLVDTEVLYRHHRSKYGPILAWIRSLLIALKRPLPG